MSQKMNQKPTKRSLQKKKREHIFVIKGDDIFSYILTCYANIFVPPSYYLTGSR